jgi:hypothetical protein
MAFTRIRGQVAPPLVVALPVSISAHLKHAARAVDQAKERYQLRQFGTGFPASRGAKLGGSRGDTVW